MQKWFFQELKNCHFPMSAKREVRSSFSRCFLVIHRQYYCQYFDSQFCYQLDLYYQHIHLHIHESWVCVQFRVFLCLSLLKMLYLAQISHHSLYVEGEISYHSVYCSPQAVYGTTEEPEATNGDIA